jgi:hypothetical protein
VTIIQEGAKFIFGQDHATFGILVVSIHSLDLPVYIEDSGGTLDEEVFYVHYYLSPPLHGSDQLWVIETNKH